MTSGSAGPLVGTGAFGAWLRLLVSCIDACVTDGLEIMPICIYGCWIAINTYGFYACGRNLQINNIYAWTKLHLSLLF